MSTSRFHSHTSILNPSQTPNRTHPRLLRIKGYRSRCVCHVAYFIKWVSYAIIMKPIAEIEKKLASKAEPILGFKPSSKIKRGPIGILISIICIAIVYRELSRAGVI